MKLTNSNLPHPRQQLNKPAIHQRRRNHYRRRREPPHAQIHTTQQERRQREARQSQRRRVRDLGFGRLVETGLGGAAEGGQASGVRGVDVREGVAAVVVGLALAGGRDVFVVGGFVGFFGHGG